MSESECKCKVIREMIMHENELVNNRLTWLCQIQGFLFAALAVTWNSGSTAPELIRYALCFAGVLVAISSRYGLNASIKAIEVLHHKGKTLEQRYDCGPIIGLKVNEPKPVDCNFLKKHHSEEHPSEEHHSEEHHSEEHPSEEHPSEEHPSWKCLFLWKLRERHLWKCLNCFLSEECLPWKLLPKILVLVWVAIFWIVLNSHSANGSIPITIIFFVR